VQWQGELTGERATIKAQLTELQHRKSALKTEQDMKVYLTKAHARARVVAATINREGPPHPTFVRASQNVATVTTLLDTFDAASINGMDKVYHQLKDILGVSTVQQAESSLQRRTEVSTSSPGHSKTSQQRAATELPMDGTASSSA
jgi:hypothetical protein